MSPNLPPFVTAPEGSFHRQIDLAALARTLEGAPLPEDARKRIVGPHDLHVLDQFREKQGVRGSSAIPADYFIWGSGEAPDRAMTKLGGVPYLPASIPWPRRDGTVGDFYAQLNFVDSKDLVPSLPGDVLLVFRFHDLEEVTSWDDELYEFIWVPMTEQELIRPEDVQCSEASAGDEWPAMHGYRVRTYDDPGQVERLLSDDALDPRLHSGEATKIGGAATDCQELRGPEVPDEYRFIGQITAIWPDPDVPYPVVNRADPVSEFPDPAYEELTSGPGDGVTSLYLDSEGAVRVSFSDG